MISIDSFKINMDNEYINLEVGKRISAHMNKDHKNSLRIYASKYLGIEDAVNIEMISINSASMTLNIDEKISHIPFDHMLIDSNDAHKTLVSMAKP